MSYGRMHENSSKKTSHKFQLVIHKINIQITLVLDGLHQANCAIGDSGSDRMFRTCSACDCSVERQTALQNR